MRNHCKYWLVLLLLEFSSCRINKSYLKTNEFSSFISAPFSIEFDNCNDRENLQRKSERKFLRVSFNNKENEDYYLLIGNRKLIRMTNEIYSAPNVEYLYLVCPKYRIIGKIDLSYPYKLIDVSVEEIHPEFFKCDYSYYFVMTYSNLEPMPIEW